jgi:hypothetical protein
MFGENQQAGVMAAPRADIGYPAAPQQEYGVRSALAELINEVKGVASQAVELRSVLGIAVPEPNTAEKAQDPDSLVGTVRVLIQILGRANANLADSIRHLRC